MKNTEDTQQPETSETTKEGVHCNAFLGAGEFKLTEQFNVKLAEFTPNYTVQFFAGKKEIGCFDFGKSPATFTGDVDESAKLFVEAVMRMWPGAPNGKAQPRPDGRTQNL